MYAVASGIIQLPRGNAISEGVTVFPVGQGWLGLALLCAGTAVADLPSYMTAGLEKSQASICITTRRFFRKGGTEKSQSSIAL